LVSIELPTLNHPSVKTLVLEDCLVHHYECPQLTVLKIHKPREFQLNGLVDFIFERDNQLHLITETMPKEFYQADPYRYPLRSYYDMSNDDTMNPWLHNNYPVPSHQLCSLHEALIQSPTRWFVEMPQFNYRNMLRD